MPPSALVPRCLSYPLWRPRRGEADKPGQGKRPKVAKKTAGRSRQRNFASSVAKTETTSHFSPETNKRSDRSTATKRRSLGGQQGGLPLRCGGGWDHLPTDASFPLEMEPHQFLPTAATAATATTTFDSPLTHSTPLLPSGRGRLLLLPECRLGY